MILYALFTFRTIHTVKITGTTYKDIIRNKDIAADILPPPSYIIESYLTVYQLSIETDVQKRNKLKQYFRKLENEYTERHSFWEKDLPEGELLLGPLATTADEIRKLSEDSGSQGKRISEALERLKMAIDSVSETSAAAFSQFETTFSLTQAVNDQNTGTVLLVYRRIDTCRIAAVCTIVMVQTMTLSGQ